jgi:hypothetical protein
MQTWEDGTRVIGIVGPRMALNSDAPRHIMLMNGHYERIPDALLHAMLAKGDNLVGIAFWKVGEVAPQTLHAPAMFRTTMMFWCTASRSFAAMHGDLRQSMHCGGCVSCMG